MRTLQLDRQTQQGSGAPNVDYTPVSGTLTFKPGVDSQAIAVPIIDDLLQEADETFSVTLSDPVNGTLDGDPVATVTILDNDQTVYLPLVTCNYR